MNFTRDIPQHIAIIMDGNGRWAKERHLPRAVGHREGIQRVREIVRAAGQMGVKVLTLFAFSHENWQRPRTEIAMLMKALDHFLDYEVRQLHESNIRLLIIGRDDPIPKRLVTKMQAAQAKTAANTGLTLVLAINYGGRQEIIDAAKDFARDVQANRAQLNSLDEQSMSRYLYTRGLPDPDILIRTSGEQRLSNYLLWQLSYAEFYFLKKYWPEFKTEDLAQAIKAYQARERRYGQISDHAETAD